MKQLVPAILLFILCIFPTLARPEDAPLSPAQQIESLKHQVAALRQQVKQLQNAAKNPGKTDFADESILFIPAAGPLVLNDKPVTSGELAKALTQMGAARTFVLTLVASPDASCKQLNDAMNLAGKAGITNLSITVMESEEKKVE